MRREKAAGNPGVGFIQLADARAKLPGLKQKDVKLWGWGLKQVDWTVNLNVLWRCLQTWDHCASSRLADYGKEVRISAQTATTGILKHPTITPTSHVPDVLVAFDVAISLLICAPRGANRGDSSMSRAQVPR